MIQDLYLRFFKENYGKIIMSFLVNVSYSLDKIGLPHYYGKLIAGMKQGNTKKIPKLFMMLVVIWTSIQGLSILREFIFSKIHPKFIGFIRINLIDKILEINKNNYQDLKTGEFMNKLGGAPYNLYGIAKEIKNIFMKNTIIYFSTFFYLFIYDKPTSLVYLISVVAVSFLVIVYIKTCRKHVRRSENNSACLSEQIDDTVTNMMSIYTSNQIKNERNRVEKFNQESVTKEKHLILYNLKFKSVFCVLFIIIFIALNYVSFTAYTSKRIKLNTLVSIVIINYTLLQQFLNIYYDVKDFMNYKERIKLLDEYFKSFPQVKKNTRKPLQKTNSVFQEPYCSVEFINLSFEYQNNKIFDNFNLKIEPRDKIALVGNIGSGKSTLVKLIVGLQSEYTGQILINGKDIMKLNIDKLRNYISYIPQHPKLFDRTLFENINYGIEDKNYTEKDIYDVLESVKLDDIAEKFKKIMHAKVGKNGSNLSGGQRQIVWLLRSLLKDNRMIILDEPTSSLDEINKKKVITLVEELSKKRNIILITHDENIIQNMNRIIKLDKGKIISDTRI